MASALFAPLNSQSWARLSALITRTTTAGDGSYLFTGVAPGTYVVRETDPPGYASTTPNEVPLSVSGGAVSTANFGDQLLGTVSGVVFNDFIGNGVQDPGETGIGSVVVTLFAAGPDRQLGTADDRLRALATVRYDAATNTVRLRPTVPLLNGNFFRLVVEGDTGLTTPAGEPIDGDGDSTPGGDFHHIFARGKELKYFDANGDRVVLRVTGGGTMELTRDLSGEGLDLRLLASIQRLEVFADE